MGCLFLEVGLCLLKHTVFLYSELIRVHREHSGVGLQQGKDVIQLFSVDVAVNKNLKL